MATLEQLKALIDATFWDKKSRDALRVELSNAKQPRSPALVDILGTQLTEEQFLQFISNDMARVFKALDTIENSWSAQLKAGTFRDDLTKHGSLFAAACGRGYSGIARLSLTVKESKKPTSTLQGGNEVLRQMAVMYNSVTDAHAYKGALDELVKLRDELAKKSPVTDTELRYRLDALRDFLTAYGI